MKREREREKERERENKEKEEMYFLPYKNCIVVRGKLIVKIYYLL